MEIVRYLLPYLAVINIMAFIIYGMDKYKARKSKWRIPESTLLLFALAGGALGAWLSMRVFRHKTRHWKFRILVPLMLMLWIVALCGLMIKLPVYIHQ